MNILQEAQDIVSGQRQEHYGKPEDSFQSIANYWSYYLHKVGRHTLGPADVAKMMILLKLAREEHQHKRDNLVDIAGYTLTLSQIEGDDSPTQYPGDIVYTVRSEKREQYPSQE